MSPSVPATYRPDGPVAFTESGTDTAMRLKTLLVALLPFALAAYISYRFVDAEVARLVQPLLMGRTGTGSGLPHVP